MKDQALVHAAAAVVLSYPDERVLAQLDTVRAGLAGTWAEPLFAPVLDHLAAVSTDDGHSLIELQGFHVAEFDLSRRHALHLTYWTEGDTRRRGEVLTTIKQVYRESGLLVDADGELPDYLPMVLEFAVRDPGRGMALLTKYRPSLELLRLGLEDDQLPHAGVLQAICRTLPGPGPRNRAEVQAMVKAVQPTETVGLDGYAAGATFLGLPDLVGAATGPASPQPQRS